MNSKQLKLLIIIFVCIGAIGALLVVQNNQSWDQGEQSIGGKVMPDFPMNDVVKVSVENKDGTVTLSKVEDTWRVADRGNYAADFAKIRELLLSVADVKVLRPMQVGESQLGRLELLTPDKGDKSGTLLSFFGENDKVLGTLLLGKQSMRKSESSSFGGGEFPDGRYLMADGDPTRIAQVSETFGSVEVEPKNWLDKAFFKVEKLKSAQVEHPDPLNNWSVSRETETGDMVLAGLEDNQELDSSRSYSLKNILSSPSFNDVAGPDATDEDLGLDTPIKASLETFDGFKYGIQIGKANAEDEYPVRLQVSADIPTERTPGEDEKEEDKSNLDKEFAEKVKTRQEKLAKEQKFQGHTFWVSKWTVDTLLKPRSDYIKKEEEEADAAGAGGAANSILPGAGLDALTNPLNLDPQ